MRVFYNSKIVKYCFLEHIVAFTLGSFIWIEFSKEDTPDWLIHHEEVHVKQYKKHGIIGFLWIYLWKERHLSYREKTFEKEAYAVSSPPKRKK